jgi:hypothetical protein
MDKVYLVTENGEAVKGISGKIEWLASYGSLLRMDAICLGFSIDQRGSSVINPSQRRVREPKEKRKEGEEKLERFSSPKAKS